MPIATGEMLYTKYEFRDLLVREAADIIQPDVCVAGGILELKKIAAMAEAFYVNVAPHNPMGPVATAVNVHLAACTPNFLDPRVHSRRLAAAARPRPRAARRARRLPRGAGRSPASGSS